MRFGARRGSFGGATAPSHRRPGRRARVAALKHPGPPSGAPPVKFAAALVTLLLPSLAAAADPRAAQANRFPIGFWCGPPDKFVTPERFKQIAAANFTFTFP